jgi:hypothetical protein
MNHLMESTKIQTLRNGLSLRLSALMQFLNISLPEIQRRNHARLNKQHHFILTGDSVDPVILCLQSQSSCINAESLSESPFRSSVGSPGARYSRTCQTRLAGQALYLAPGLLVYLQYHHKMGISCTPQYLFLLMKLWLSDYLKSFLISFTHAQSPKSNRRW